MFYCNAKYDKDNIKVRHHNHITGEFINPCCNNCNLQFKIKKFVPVYIHNLKGYDSHFLVPALNNYGYRNDEEDLISAIPNTEEKYISFSKEIQVDEYEKKNEIKPVKFEIRFLDSLAFMASSLSNLAENLNPFKGKEREHINELRQIFKYVASHFDDDEQFLMMIKKGVYPYDYIDSYEKLFESQLPTQENFYSKLSNEKCNDEDYLTAKLVWRRFKCKNMLDYHNIYLASDVLLLSDIWSNFKDTCYRIYKLDASYYYTAPSLSWDAFLKHITEEYKSKGKEFQIELLTDMDMYLMWESAIRGGLSQISKRYAKANNKYMKDYDETKDDEYIVYLDANNLYGYGMSSYLPIGGFKWNSDEWTKEKIMELNNEGKTGYLFDVDLHYPKELHDLHNGYALASNNSEIKKEWLNDWQQNKYKESNIKKLITSFHDKSNYVVNYRLLKLFLSLGLVLKKVNRVIEYDQDDYMKSYIMKNTNERANTKNDFEKDFYKLMNNSVYGKTMENVRNRINFKLLSSSEKALALRNQLKKSTIFNENLVGVHICKKEVILNKPIFIGQNVLDESKLLMYNFHYNFMLKKFKRENIDLLFTDTDSLAYHIRNQDPYEIINQNKSLFDLSNYPKEDKLFDKTNNKVIGKFKDEQAGKQIIEFIGLRSKCYSYITDDIKSHIKAKGIKKYITKNKDTSIDAYYLNHQNYYNCLFNRNPKKISQNTFRSKRHQLYLSLIHISEPTRPY